MRKFGKNCGMNAFLESSRSMTGHWKRNEILKTEGERTEETLEEFEEEFAIPENPNDIRLEAIFEIDSKIGSNDEASYEQLQEGLIDSYSPLFWEEMIEFDKGKAKEIEKG